MTLLDNLTELKALIESIKNNKVINLSYTEEAYSNNNVDSTTSFSETQEQNIPVGTEESLKVNETIFTKGYRAMGSTLTRNMLNHFFGRASYNLNKVVDNLYVLLTAISSTLNKANGLLLLDENGLVPVSNGGTGNSSVDTVPTTGSTKMVTSSGIKSYVDNKEVDISKLTGILPVENGGTGNSSVDTVPTAGSTKMVTSEGIKSYVDNREVDISKSTGILSVENGGTGNGSVDTVPTAGSTKMVTSDGIKEYADNKPSDITKAKGILDAHFGGTNHAIVDTVPTNLSNKMVTSDGLYNTFKKFNGFISYVNETTGSSYPLF